MRIRIIPQEDGTILAIGEVQSGKGKRATTGRAVKPEDFRAEVERLIRECRGESPRPVE